MREEPLDGGLAARVARLEQEIRWWRRLGAGTVLAFGVVALLGASQAPVADEVRAKRFTLVDDDGATQAELGVFTAADGGQMPRLAFWGKERRLVAQFDAFPSVNLLAKDEASRVTLSVRDDGDPSLAFVDHAGTTRVILGRADTKAGGEPKQLPVSSLVLFGEDGKPVWKAP